MKGKWYANGYLIDLISFKKLLEKGGRLTIFRKICKEEFFEMFWRFDRSASAEICSAFASFTLHANVNIRGKSC